MRDKTSKKREKRELPPPCLGCRSLHKQYKTMLCLARQFHYYKLELMRSLPIIGRLAPEWACDLRGIETVEDIERDDAQ